MNASNPIHTLLVPVDFSDVSARGLHQAMVMAQAMGARVVLLHILEMGLHFEGATVPDHWRGDEKTRRVRESLKEFADLHALPGVETSEVVLVRPKVGSAILEFATDIGADLIVMGTHQKHGIAHLLLGSNAENVSRHAPCPVTLVGPGAASFREAA